MFRKYILLVKAISFFAIANAQVLIKNTNVVDVEKKKILEGYDVVVLDGRVTSVDKGKMFKLPPGTEVIDGSGKYLIPGLVDAHVHFSQSGGLFTRPDVIDLRKYHPYEQEIKWTHDNMDETLRRYLSIGITSVIDVGTTFNFLAQRDTFATKNYAPTITMTGPLLTTYVPNAFKNLGKDGIFIEMTSEASAREGVQQQISGKADFVKIWYIVLDSNIERGAMKNLAYVKAAIDEAHKNNLRVAVHATEQLTAKLAVEAGADFLVHGVEDRVLSNDFVQLLKKKKTVLSPTLVVAGNYGHALGDTYKFTSDELNLSNPTQVRSIINYPRPDTLIAQRYIKRMQATAAEDKTRDSITSINLKKLADAGVIIATGTDAGNIGTQHVGSYFEELKAMQDAGLNMWQLLQASTLHAAKAVAKDSVWGSITKGKMGNMVLLDANPLDSLPNWRKINRVINKGTVWEVDSLVKMSPEALVQQQLNAYNAHDLEGFLAPYAENVEIYSFPNGKLLSKGKDLMRANYVFVTQVPDLFCKLVNRTVEGNVVIDHEEVTGFGSKPVRALAIYVIEKNKISKVYFPE